MATILRRPRHRTRRETRRRTEVEPPVVRPELPVTVLVHPGVLRSIGAAVGAVPTETGGPLIGTIQRSWDVAGDRLIASVLVTVPPGPSIRAGYSSVALGQSGDGERAASALRWWRSVTGLDLRHLGDWHKHPSGLPEPSGGDRATGRRMRFENDASVWLTGIVVGERSKRENVEAQGHLVRLGREWDATDEVRFYREQGPSGLVRVPVRVEAAAIPRLPALPWHVTDPVRFGAECRLLQAAGFRIEIEAGGRDRQGVALRLREDGREPITLVTGPRYPFEAPAAFDGDGRRVRVTGPWSPTRFLVDVAKGVS